MPSIETPTAPPSRSVAAAWAGSSAATAAATCGMCLPKRGPERAVVRLQLPRAELVGLGDEAQPLHVELLEHEVLEALDRLALAVGGDDDRLGQRLAHLDLRLRARRAAELDRLARDRHRLLERPRRARRVGLRVVAEVHRRLGAVEVLVDRVGDERDQRREQLRTLTRHSRSVANAATSPSQKRRRERRTYQFDRSSTNAAIARPAAVVS